MIKSTILPLSISLALIGCASASTVLLSVGFTGPRAFQPDGVTPVNTGTILLGTLTGTPASDSVEDIQSVFQIFGEALTTSTGGLGNSVTNLDADSFNSEPIALWIFDGPANATASSHALLSLADPDRPTSGSAWRYPVHIGNAFDTVTIELGALSNADPLRPSSVRIEGEKIILGAVPEPSASLFLAIGGSIVTLLRRRQI